MCKEIKTCPIITPYKTNLKALTAICRVPVELPESDTSTATMEAVILSLCSNSAIQGSWAKFPIKRQARHCMLSLAMLWITEANGPTIP